MIRRLAKYALRSLPVAVPGMVIALVLFGDGDVPGMRQEACVRHLRAVWSYAKVYMERNQGRPPGNIYKLESLSAKYSNLWNFKCNRDNLPWCKFCGRRFSGSSSCHPALHSSYYFVNYGDRALTPSENAHFPLMFDRPGNHDGHVNVLFADGHVEKLELSGGATSIFDSVRRAHKLGDGIFFGVNAHESVRETELSFSLRRQNPEFGAWMRKALAEANRLDSKDVNCNLMGKLIWVRFDGVPEKGYDLSPLVAYLKSCKLVKYSETRFRIRMPGGNLTPFLALAEFGDLELSKADSIPAMFDPVFSPGVAIPPRSISFEGFFTMGELMTLPENQPADTISISVLRSPFDWLFLKRFPNLKSLSFHMTSRFVNADKVDSVNCSLSFQSCEDLKLPAKLNGPRFRLAIMPLKPEYFGHLTDDGLVELRLEGCSDFEGFPPMRRFVNCETVEIASARSLSSFVFSGMPSLKKLYVSGGDLKDLSALREMPALEHLVLRSCGGVSYGSLSGLRARLVELYGDYVEDGKPEKKDIEGIDTLFLGLRTFHNGVEKRQ